MDEKENKNEIKDLTIKELISKDTVDKLYAMAKDNKCKNGVCRI